MKITSQHTLEQLLQQAKEASQAAYAPYSRYKVGSAVLTSTGEVFSGCNVENASYGLTLCAERNAISSMVAAGHIDLVVIAIVSPNTPGCYPCGACRQWIYEFNPEAMVVVEGDDLKPKTMTIKELLPNAFGKDSLE